MKLVQDNACWVQICNGNIQKANASIYWNK